MLSASDTSLDVVMRAFARHGVEAGFLVPTRTGLEKGIMDAHGQLRAFLYEKGIHDFAAQGQGPGDKVVTEARILAGHGFMPARISLYRPLTKVGDPRIWIYGLQKLAQPGNLIALLVHDGIVHVANVSAPGALASMDDPGSALGSLVQAITRKATGPAIELLEKLREISSRGFITTLRDGDTGVGMTLETLLGIAANSSKEPDFKGIEIKAARQAPNRNNLFAKTPDWGRSAVGSAAGLLDAYGYDNGEGKRLYCTLRHIPNAQGLYLTVEGSDLLTKFANGDKPMQVLAWAMKDLRSALEAKHRETFWIKAATRRRDDGREEFHYTSARHTRSPISSNLGPLLQEGKVQLDLLLKFKSRHGRAVRDHGYLFKIHPTKLDLLFPPSVTHDLAAR